MFHHRVKLIKDQDHVGSLNHKSYKNTTLRDTTFSIVNCLKES